MKSAHTMHVQTEVRGDVPAAAVKLAVAKIRSLLRIAPEPVLFARVTLAMAADPASSARRQSRPAWISTAGRSMSGPPPPVHVRQPS